MSDIRREDQARVITDDGRMWDGMTALVMTSAKGDDSYEDIILTRAAGLNPETVMNYMRRMNKRIALLITGLDRAAWPGQSVAVGGRVKEVKLAPYDSNSTDIALDQITIKVEKVVPL